MKLAAALLVVLVLAAILPPAALAQGPVWQWTGQIVTLDGGWWFFQPVQYCVYRSGALLKYVPVTPGYAGRLYCSPYIY